MKLYKPTAKITDYKGSKTISLNHEAHEYSEPLKSRSFSATQN